MAAAATIEDGGTAAATSSSSVATLVDEIYEYSAPRYFDFTRAESEEEAREAELWFDTALTYAPSPFMPRIKTGRSFKVESLCDFTEADQNPKATESSDSTDVSAAGSSETKSQPEDHQPAKSKEEEAANKENNGIPESPVSPLDAKDVPCKFTVKEAILFFEQKQKAVLQQQLKEQMKTETCCTPQPPANSQKGGVSTDSKRHQSARHIASLVKNPSVLKSKNQAQFSHAKSIKPSSVKKGITLKNPAGAPAIGHENQAIKRQKLEDGKSRQILNVKPAKPLLHKSKLGLSTSKPIPSSAANKTHKVERKLYVRDPAVRAPFTSTAEMMQKFQSGARDLSLPLPPGKPKLKLTRPKEPDFQTSQRVRPVTVKSSAELEEEMLAKIPKFKARPVNKKILHAPTLPYVPRSTPKEPEFQEFHLETTARANVNAESASVASTEVSRQHKEWKPRHFTEPKPPKLQTSLRARPTTVKSSLELEKEALEKMPKFKAKPLNKKIFESKGELGIFCNTKKQVTIPQEFHFAIDERIPPAAVVTDMFDMFDKLSLSSESHGNLLSRNTVPNPFNLQTEDRGAEKERRLAMELMQKQMEDELARVRKANPYPYTTDYPVVPPKPDRKQCTRPEPFQLESLVRHEQEVQKEMEERQRKEREEAQMRLYKAQPILKEDPIPLPEKVRRPLTEVQQIKLHVDHRAPNRAEFDHKVKEKEMVYKRYREESEAAKMIEEEKALKQLRRTMVPHARPVPKFDKPFFPQKSSRDATRPKSPRLRVLRRREKQKSSMTAAAAATGCSTPASCMR